MFLKLCIINYDYCTPCEFFIKSIHEHVVINSRQIILHQDYIKTSYMEDQYGTAATFVIYSLLVKKY